jgi:hypothetical protein
MNQIIKFPVAGETRSAPPRTTEGETSTVWPSTDWTKLAAGKGSIVQHRPPPFVPLISPRQYRRYMKSPTLTATERKGVSPEEYLLAKERGDYALYIVLGIFAVAGGLFWAFDQHASVEHPEPTELRANP